MAANPFWQLLKDLSVSLELLVLLIGLSVALGAEVARLWFNKQTDTLRAQIEDLENRATRIERHIGIPAGGTIYETK